MDIIQWYLQVDSKVLLLNVEDGSLYTFGYSAHGQLGLHNTINQCIPQPVTDFYGVKIAQIAAGWNHSLVLTERGDLYACGHGESGQLGIGDTEIIPNFTHVSPMGPKNIAKIFAGGNHTWALLDYQNPNRDYTPPPPLRSPQPIKSPPKAPPEGLSLEDMALLNVHKEALERSNCKFQLNILV